MPTTNQPDRPDVREIYLSLNVGNLGDFSYKREDWHNVKATFFNGRLVCVDVLEAPNRPKPKYSLDQEY